MTGVGAQLLVVFGEVVGKAAGLVAEIDRDLDLVESGAVAGLEVSGVGFGLKHCNLGGYDILVGCLRNFWLRATGAYHNLFD